MVNGSTKVKKIFVQRVSGKDIEIDNPLDVKNGEYGWSIIDENYLEIFIPTRNILGVEIQHEKLNRID